MLAAESGLRADLFQRGAGTHPELAVGRVGVELLGRTRSARAEVQNRLVRAIFARFKNQHRIRFALATEARKVRERGVCAETVITVVTAHLVRARGDHQALALERLAGCFGALGQIVGCSAALHFRLDTRPPAGAHERAERVRRGATASSFPSLSHRCGCFFRLVFLR
ncbi:Uncharacterised protein [Chlamydia trachomatis]|nr:Uncharacterised protein [Chlamydia trachomatis]